MESCYSHLDYQTIYNDFKFCLSLIDIFIRCGFERKKTNDGYKLIFNTQKSQRLREITESLNVKYEEFRRDLTSKKFCQLDKSTGGIYTRIRLSKQELQNL